MILNKVIFDVQTKKDVPINLQEIIKSRMLLQANSGGGKSHIIRKFCEKAHDKVQQIIIDPEGEFHTLREKYEYLLVAKGNHADIQIEPKHAALLAKKLMETGANAILDLYELNPSERIRFVKLFVDALVNLPKNLWHPCIIVIDEIHTFAPESKSGRSESLAAVAALASRGRKRGYALVGATQRISKLSKDIAAELNTKLIGRCSLDGDRKRAADELGLKDSIVLRKLQHEFYAFGPAISNENILVKAEKTETFSDELGSTADYNPINKSKINSLLKNFSELPQEAELDLKTKEGLQLKVQELQTKLRVAERHQTVIKQDAGELNKAWKKGYDEATANMKPTITSYEKYILAIKKNASNIKQTIAGIESKTENDFNLILQTGPVIPESPTKLLGINLTKSQKSQLSSIVSSIPAGPTITSAESANSLQIDSEVKLGRCEESILKALAQRGKECSKLQIATVAGYSSKSGGFNNSISKLKNLEFITVNGNISITQAGLDHIGDNYQRIPDDPESLLNMWKSKLGKCPATILQYLYDIHPSYAPKNNIAETTGYSAGSGGFNNGISKLNSLGLTEKSSEGFLRITDEVMYS